MTAILDEGRQELAEVRRSPLALLLQLLEQGLRCWDLRLLQWLWRLRGLLLRLLLLPQSFANVFLPDGHNHVGIRAGARGTTRGKVFVAHVDVVAGVLQTDGRTPRREFRPRFLGEEMYVGTINSALCARKLQIEQ